jgi:hypothetical protein
MLGLFGAREATAPQPESDCPSEMHGELFVGFKPGPIGIFRSGSARHWANVDCALCGQRFCQVVPRFNGAGPREQTTWPDDCSVVKEHVAFVIAPVRSACANGDPVSGLSRVAIVRSGPSERLRSVFDFKLYKLVVVKWRITKPPML